MLRALLRCLEARLMGCSKQRGRCLVRMVWGHRREAGHLGWGLSAALQARLDGARWSCMLIRELYLLEPICLVLATW